MKLFQLSTPMSAVALCILLTPACDQPPTDLDQQELAERAKLGAKKHPPTDAQPKPDPRPDAGPDKVDRIDAMPRPPLPVDAMPLPPPPAPPPPVPTACNPTTPPHGRIAQYGFDERDGAVAADTFGNNGIVAPNASWVAGRKGNALSLDGGSAVAVADNEAIDSTGITGQVSLSAWVLPRAAASGRQSIINRREEGTELKHFGLFFEDGRIKFTIHIFEVQSNVQIPSGVWTHVGATYDGITARLFINGTAAGSSDLGWPISADRTPLIIGAELTDGERLKNFFTGLVDEVVLYNRTLDDNEVRMLSGACGVKPEIPPVPPVIVVPPPDKTSAIAHYAFNDGRGPIATDEYGNHGIVTGKTSWGKGSLLLDGATLVTAKDTTAIDITGITSSVSVATWVRVDDFDPKGWNFVVNRSESDTDFEHFGLGIFGGRPAASIHFFKVQSATPVPLNSWVHLAMTYDGITVTLYVNGQQQATLDVGWPIAADKTPLTIGAELNKGVPAGFFHGGIDDVTLYSHALSARQVAALAASRP